MWAIMRADRLAAVGYDDAGGSWYDPAWSARRGWGVGRVERPGVGRPRLGRGRAVNSHAAADRGAGGRVVLRRRSRPVSRPGTGDPRSPARPRPAAVTTGGPRRASAVRTRRCPPGRSGRGRCGRDRGDPVAGRRGGDGRTGAGVAVVVRRTRRGTGPDRTVGSTSGVDRNAAGHDQRATPASSRRSRSAPPPHHRCSGRPWLG